MATKQVTPPTKIITPGDGHSTWTTISLGIAITAVTLAVHYPAIQGGYIWDDNVSLYENPLIVAPGGLYKFWLSTEPSDYWPITSTVFWIGWRIWGNNPVAFHLLNMILHAIAAVMLWRVLLRLQLGQLGSFLTAVFFAIHPVTVESVAWISELKNVLSMALFLLAILVYLRFEEQKNVQWYVVALLIALGALLAKASVVMLPALLLICIGWRRSRLTRQDLLYTLPFFAMSLILGLVTIWFQHKHIVGTSLSRPEGIASRIASIGWVFWFYLYKIIVPVNLAMVYPRWRIEAGNALSYIPLVFSLGLFALLWHYRKSWGRGPLFCLSAFAVILAPVLGLLDMSYAHYSLVADHLQYPGIPAVLVLVGTGLAAAGSWSKKTKRSSAVAGVTVLVGVLVMTMAVLTWRQSQVYRDEVTLWSHSIACYDDVWAAYDSRGAAYAAKGDYDQALRDCNRAIQLNPTSALSYYNRGLANDGRGDYDNSIRDYTQAIALDPKHARAYNNRGAAYAHKGNHPRALQDCDNAIEIHPNYAIAYFNRGNVYAAVGNSRQAIADYTQAIALRPNYTDAYTNRGAAYAGLGDLATAIQDYSKAIESKPNCAAAYDNRGAAYAGLGNLKAALQDHDRAIELNPSFVTAYNNRGNVYAAMNENARALQDYTRAIELNPGYVSAYYNRGLVYKNIGRFTEAIQDFTQTITLKPDAANAYNDRGAAYEEVGNLNQAILDCSKAIELNPYLATAFSNRAVAYFFLKQFDQAWADVKQCRQLGGAPNPLFIEHLTKQSGRNE